MTMEAVDPRKYNLSPRTKLLKDGSESIFIVIDRKSRVVMKDGNRLVKMAKNIKEVNQKINTSLLTSAPVCSKTKKLLYQNNIPVLSL